MRKLPVIDFGGGGDLECYGGAEGERILVVSSHMR